jgi:hypothetical protein
MCKEMLVILINRMVNPKKNNRKKWRAEEEERHKKVCNNAFYGFIIP